MPLMSRLLADIVLILHVGYVAFVVLGLAFIWLGMMFRWECVRNPWFRGIHLAAILIVVAESVVGITCPLTTLENALRRGAGQTTYQGDFIAIWMHDLLFIQAEPWVFQVMYAGFALGVLLTLLFAPPRWPVRQAASDSAPAPSGKHP